MDEYVEVVERLVEIAATGVMAASVVLGALYVVAEIVGFVLLLGGRDEGRPHEYVEHDW